MNNNYFSSSSVENYLPNYNYPFEYSSPSTSAYSYSPLLPSSCPLHSPHIYYPSSINISPLSYTYQQQPQSQVYSPSAQQYNTVLPGVDRTPLRRHRCFKKNELQRLHQAYIHDPHPPTNVVQQLAIDLKAPVDKVRQWFKNRRHSDKLKNREMPTQRVSTTT